MRELSVREMASLANYFSHLVQDYVAASFRFMGLMWEEDSQVTCGGPRKYLLESDGHADLFCSNEMQSAAPINSIMIITHSN